MASQHELKRRRVDRLPQRGGEQRIRVAPEPEPLVGAELVSHFEVHRAGEGLVDAVDDGADLLLHGGRRLDLDAVSCTDAHLHEDVAVAVVLVLREQLLPREQLRSHALEPVEIVDGGDDSLRAPAGSLDGIGAQDLGLSARHGQQPRLHLARTDAECRHLQNDVPALVLDAEEAALLVLVLEGEHALAAGEEVTRVLEHQKADQVDVEERAQQLEADGDGTPDVGGGEGRVHEEANLDEVDLAHDERGHHQ
mmetsp:Transcript_48889/g.104369  ORF Transcript_48889/g.104369 Transcript_48889/m.104369 type:complete len:252 (-) Transcript_48889:391-1146(-)